MVWGGTAARGWIDRVRARSCHVRSVGRSVVVDDGLDRQPVCSRGHVQLADQAGHAALRGRRDARERPALPAPALDGDRADRECHHRDAGLEHHRLQRGPVGAGIEGEARENRQEHQRTADEHRGGEAILENGGKLAHGLIPRC